MCPPHQWSLHDGKGKKVMAALVQALCRGTLMLASFCPSLWKMSQLVGQSLQEEELCRCVFTAHVKASKVFHWAGQSDTLPQDLHGGSRDFFSSSSPAVAVMDNTCCHGNWGGGKRGKQLVSDQYGSRDCKAAWGSAHKWSEELSFL